VNPERFRLAVYEIGLLLRSERCAVAGAVFGSVARDEATEESDLDLVIVLAEGVRDAARGALWDRLVSAAARFDVDASIIFTDRRFGGLDVQLVESILRHSKPVKGRLPDPGVRALNLRPMRLVKYHLKGLSQQAKLRLNRILFGWATVKRIGRKKYRSRSPGLLARLGAERVGAGAILVPEAGAGELERVLVSLGAKRLMIPVWEQAR